MNQLYESQNNAIARFLSNRKTNFFISLFIIASLILLAVQQLGKFSVQSENIFFLIDQYILIFFSFEFLLKLFFLGKYYLITELGWIDFLAALPVITPLVKYLLFQFNIDLIITQEAVTITVILRGFKIIRFLRLMRAARILKVFTNYNNSCNFNNGPFPIAIPVIFSFILLISGYLFMNYIEQRFKSERIIKMEKTFELINEKNIKDLLFISPEILLIQKGNLFDRSISDKSIIKLYQPYEQSRIKSADGFILFSLKDIIDISKKLEFVIMVLITMYMFFTYLQFNQTIKIFKNK
jgi:hypothetical protein